MSIKQREEVLTAAMRGAAQSRSYGHEVRGGKPTSLVRVIVVAVEPCEHAIGGNTEAHDASGCTCNGVSLSVAGDGRFPLDMVPALLSLAARAVVPAKRRTH